MQCIILGHEEINAALQQPTKEEAMRKVAESVKDMTQVPVNASFPKALDNASSQKGEKK